MDEIKMELTPNFAFVPGIRACFSRIASNFGFGERDSYHIEIVVDEICNNAIEHGCKAKDKAKDKRENEKIEIECRLADGRMELITKDKGDSEFNVEEVLRRNIELFKEESTKGLFDTARRGRGLVIIQKLVDSLDIKTGKTGTTVRILKKVVK